MPSLLGTHYGCPNGASLFGPDSDPKTSDQVSVTELPTTMAQTQSTMWHSVKHITAMWLMLCVQHTMKIMMVMVMVGQHHWSALSTPLASSTGHHHGSAPLAGNIGQDPWQHVTNTSVFFFHTDLTSFTNVHDICVNRGMPQALHEVIPLPPSEDGARCKYVYVRISINVQVMRVYAVRVHPLDPRPVR